MSVVVAKRIFTVMAGLDPAIHAFVSAEEK
jgi:hypothetical protein